jgi:hypothetical protein
MAKLPMLADAARAPTTRERVLLFCIVSGTDRDRAAIPGAAGMILSAGLGKD